MDAKNKEMREEKNKACEENGVKIFLELKEKYPDDSLEHFDMILNSLCVPLVCMIHRHVKPERALESVELVNTILKKNISCWSEST